jgi:hypothetical protein
MAALKDAPAEPSGNITDLIGGNEGYTTFESLTKVIAMGTAGDYVSFTGFIPEAVAGSSETWGVLN